MERIVKLQLIDYLLNNNLITRHQHGFLSKRSTVTNLIEASHDWVLAVSDRKAVDVVYVDFSRAFDSIVFSKLLIKLQQYGIAGKLLSWISAFLHNRTQCVVLENCFSSICDVLSGVPQGSVLGPLLFLIFVNDVTSVSVGETALKLYADDVKLYSVIENNSSSVSLQQSLDLLTEWSHKWQLSINANKCSVFSISNPPYNSSRSYHISGTTLSAKSSVSDLGIQFDSALSYKNHISNIIAKAKQRVGIFLEVFLVDLSLWPVKHSSPMFAQFSKAIHISGILPRNT